MGLEELKEFMNTGDEKYVVLPIEAVESIVEICDEGRQSGTGHGLIEDVLGSSFLMDAMVIRTQDQFAGAALRGYIAAVEAFRMTVGTLCPGAVDAATDKAIDWYRLYEVESRFGHALQEHLELLGDGDTKLPS